MKKLFTLVLCLCALFSIGLTMDKEEAASQEEVPTRLAKNDKPVVRDGASSEGIYLL